jgi:hypothetical protein
MTLPSSGAISIGAANVEQGQAAATAESMLALRGATFEGGTGAFSLSALYGKTWCSDCSTSFYFFATCPDCACVCSCATCSCTCTCI